MNKQALWGSTLLFVLAIAGCSAPPTPAKPTPTAAPYNGAPSGGQIIAQGRVTPVKGAALSFATGGVVAQIPVAVGDQVKAGQTLVNLDSQQLTLALAQADGNLAAAQAKLNQLSRGPTAADLAAAQQNLAFAQAAYADLTHPGLNEMIALKTDVDKTQALFSQAQAAYDQIGGGSNPNIGMLPQAVALQQAAADYQKALAAYNARLNPSPVQNQQALAAVQNAQDQLAKLQPTTDDLALAKGNLAAAQAARDLAAQQIKDAQLVAPFAGMVSTVEINPGEYVAAGAEVLRLADTSAWQVETTDLTELNVANVHEGLPVAMTFDALPGLELTGKVSKIEWYGETKQGDIVYTVFITPDKQDARLRWNMTAKVTIQTTN